MLGKQFFEKSYVLQFASIQLFENTFVQTKLWSIIIFIEWMRKRVVGVALLNISP